MFKIYLFQFVKQATGRILNSTVDNDYAKGKLFDRQGFLKTKQWKVCENEQFTVHYRTVSSPPPSPKEKEPYADDVNFFFDRRALVLYF
ncbi:MAG: hypothetical protein ABIQ31_06440 [Ferruginibacter sp.]